MSDVDRYDILVLGSGESGKYLAWTMAAAGRRTAVIEQKLIGGSYPNVACLPSKNIIHSAKVKSLALRASAFGFDTGAMSTDMKAVQERKRRMVADLIQVHVDWYEAAGVELIRGKGRFVGTRTSGEHSRIIESTKRVRPLRFPILLREDRADAVRAVLRSFISMIDGSGSATIMRSWWHTTFS